MSRRVRVAVFTDNDFAKVNGVTTTLTELVRHAPADIAARIYTASSVTMDEPHYLSVRAFGFPIPYYRSMDMYVPPIRRLLAHARRDRIDVVHLTTPGPVGLAAAFVASRMGVPVVGSFHTDLTAYARLLSGSPHLAAWLRRYMRWVYGRAVTVLAPSESTRRLLVADGIPSRRIGLWVRGVDTDLFSPAHRSDALRAAWGVNDRRPALLFVGRVSAEKGLDQLPLIADRLRADGLPHRFVIVGDGPYRRTLEAAMPDACFTGTLSRVAVAQAFASADLFVFPSRTDTAGNVVLEAQASGLPVVVSEAGGPHENMVDGATGLVCAGTWPRTWSDAIARLLGDDDLRRDMGKAARAYACRRTWPDSLMPVYRAYASACAPERAGVDRGLAMPARPVERHS